MRNAYCCLDCKKVFAMPLGQSLTRYLLAPVFTHLTKKDYSPIEKFDYLCLNLSCQRRNEAGYKACMNMSDPCWFCLRFGNEQLCHTRVVHTFAPTAILWRQRPHPVSGCRLLQDPRGFATLTTGLSEASRDRFSMPICWTKTAQTITAI